MVASRQNTDSGTAILPAGRSGRVGLVSDTHGIFDPLLEEYLHGVDAILHAGDVGTVEVLEKLKKIAPVVAVLGNVDCGVAGLKLPSFAKRNLLGIRILITHYTGEPDCPLPPVALAIKKEHPALVLSGHTHKPQISKEGGILFVNPGSCGPRRGNLPRTCGMLTVNAKKDPPEPLVELFDLDLHKEYVL